MLKNTTISTKLSHFYSLVISSLKGEPQDYTSGSLRTAVILLAVPMILEMCMESVFAIVDLFFVGRLGKHAITTVGLTESVLTIIYSLAIGMSMAATAVVARRIGEKDKPGASSAAMQSIILSVGIIFIISMCGMIFAKDVLSVMGAEPETIKRGATYTRIMMASSMIIMLLFLINGIFRGAGDASIAMKSLWIANIGNIILCPLFINGFGFIPAFGVTGAAMATSIGRSSGVIYQLYHLFKGKSLIRLSRKSFIIQPEVITNLVKVAWPATVQFIIASCSWIFLAQLVAKTGHSAASAGYQAAIRIIMFFLLPAWGVSNAAATLVGQNLGAKEPLRAEMSVMKTAKYNAIFMAVVSLFFILTGNSIVGILVQQEEVRVIAVRALQIISSGYIFYGVGMVLTSSFNGAGDTKTPTIINLFGFWAFQIPLAYLLAKYFNMGPTGVFIAIPAAEVAITITAYILFKKGKWKLIKV
jgi:putative MATE family efflux protein